MPKKTTKTKTTIKNKNRPTVIPKMFLETSKLPTGIMFKQVRPKTYNEFLGDY